MPTVTFVKENKQVEVPAGSNLRREALRAGVPLYNGINGLGAGLNSVLNCHGLAHCGTCRVKILKGQENAGRGGFPLLNLLEPLVLKFSPAMAAYIGNEESLRLACCVAVNGDMEVETGPEMNLFGENFFS